MSTDTGNCSEAALAEMEARGFRRFLIRGLEKVQGEWSMLCTAHNLLKLHMALGAT